MILVLATIGQFISNLLMNWGKNAKVIGTVVEAHPKQVILESAIGGKRVVSMLPGEQLPRIC